METSQPAQKPDPANENFSEQDDSQIQLLQPTKELPDQPDVPEKQNLGDLVKLVQDDDDVTALISADKTSNMPKDVSIDLQTIKPGLAQKPDHELIAQSDSGGPATVKEPAQTEKSGQEVDKTAEMSKNSNIALNQNQQEQNSTSKTLKTDEILLIPQSADNSSTPKPIPSYNQIVPEDQQEPVAQKQKPQNYFAKNLMKIVEPEQIKEFLKEQQDDPGLSEKFLESAQLLQNLQWIQTPADKVTHIQTVVLPNFPDYYMKVTHFECVIKQKGLSKQKEPEKQKIEDSDKLFRQKVTQLINNKKTSKHNYYESYTVTVDAKSKAAFKKTEEPQFRFERDTFYLFQVFNDHKLVSEWALYDWVLEEYHENFQNIIRLSVDKLENQKVYFFASKDNQCELFVLEQSQLIQQQTFPSKKPCSLLETSKNFKINSLRPRKCKLLEIVEERVVWWLQDDQLVLTQQLQDGSEQKQYKNSEDKLVLIPSDQNNWKEQIALLGDKQFVTVQYDEFQSTLTVQKSTYDYISSLFYTNNYGIRLDQQQKQFYLFTYKNEKKEQLVVNTKIGVTWVVNGEKVFVCGQLDKETHPTYKISLWEFSKTTFEKEHEFKAVNDFNELPNLKHFYFQMLYDVEINSFEVNLLSVAEDFLECELRFNAYGTDQIVLVRASTDVKVKTKVIQINNPREFIIQYPFIVNRVGFDGSIRIRALDTDQSQLQLKFNGYDIFDVGRNTGNPLTVIALLQSQNNPNELSIAKINLEFCDDAFSKSQTDSERSQYLADALNDISKPSARIKIKSVEISEAPKFEKLKSPIIEFVFWSRDQDFFYIQTYDSLIFIQSIGSQNLYEKTILDNCSTQVLPIKCGFVCFCVVRLENGNYQIKKSAYNYLILVCDIILPGLKVIALQVMKGDRLQYLCSNNSIYDQKGTELYQCGELDLTKGFVWSDRSFVSIKRNRIMCYVFETKLNIDVTEQLGLQDCDFKKLRHVEGTNKFEIQLTFKGKSYIYVGQMIDSTQCMLTSPWLIRQLGGDECIQNISLHRNKGMLRIGMHCLVYDRITHLLLHYQLLPDKDFKISIQENILRMGCSKYHLDQATLRQFIETETQNTLFFDESHVCLVSNEESESSVGITLVHTGPFKRFECKFGSDVKCDQIQQCTNTGNYIVWTSKGKVLIVELLSHMQKLKKDTKSSVVVRGQNIKEITLSDFFDQTKLESIRPVSEEFINYAANDCETRNEGDRKRTEVIQILTEDHALIWDLKDHEEIKVTDRNKNCPQFQFVTDEFSCGNQHQLIIRDTQNDQDFPEEKKVIYQLYSGLDLALFKLYLSNKNSVEVESLTLLSKIYGQTFFSLTSDKQFITLIEGTVKNLLDKSVSIKTKDPEYFDNLMRAMLTKVDFDKNDKKKQKVDPFSECLNTYYYGLSTQKNEASELSNNKYKERQTIFEVTIDDIDKKKFQELLKLLLEAKQAKHSHIINTIERMSQLLQIKDKHVQNFVKKNYIKTKVTEQIKTLDAYETDDIVCFSSNTTMLSEKAIIENFTKAIDDYKGFLGLFSQLFGKKRAEKLNEYTFKNADRLAAVLKNETYTAPVVIKRSYDILILEIEWLENRIIPFLVNTIQNPDHFEIEIIKILLDEMSYPWSLYVFLFLPYAAYCGVLTYYYGFCLTQAQDERTTSFIKGQTDAIVLRFVILAFTAYFFIIEYFQIQAEMDKYYQGIWDNLLYIFMLALNIWIITEHATSFTNCDPVRLSQVASVEMLQLWYYLFKWFRIFDQFAVFVELITKVVYNTRYFMVMLILILCGFGFATLILDRQMIQQTSDEFQTYQSLTSSFFNAFTVNVIFSQYLLGIGQADTSTYDQNPSKQLLWCFYFLETFLTQITFFNMLISVMGSTYEEVMSFSDRNKLIMRTEIYSEYAGFLNLIETQIPQKFNKRYLYIAKQKIEEEKTDTQKVIDEIRKVEEKIEKIAKDQEKIAKDQDTKIEKIARDHQEQYNAMMKLLEQIAAKK